MNTDTIEIDGYKVVIAQDEVPENPFENRDCEPPLVTYYGGRHGYAKSYQGAPETMREILHMLPADTWDSGKRVEFFKKFMADKFVLKDVAWEIRRQGNTFEAMSDLLSAEYGEKPDGWRSALEWFKLAESLLNYAGIPCQYEQSDGYSQGDSTLCLVVLTPEWFEKSGASPEHSDEICKSAINLCSAWAWGDVYGGSEIIAPGPLDEDGYETDGEEVEDSSCWGFYGSDHEQSGLLEHARSMIEWHKEKQAKESAELEAAFSFAG